MDERRQFFALAPVAFLLIASSGVHFLEGGSALSASSSSLGFFFFFFFTFFPTISKSPECSGRAAGLFSEVLMVANERVDN